MKKHRALIPSEREKECRYNALCGNCGRFLQEVDDYEDGEVIVCEDFYGGGCGARNYVAFP